MARDWIKPPPDTRIGLRVPIEYASLHAAVRSASYTPEIVSSIRRTSDWLRAHIFMYVLP